MVFWEAWPCPFSEDMFIFVVCCLVKELIMSYLPKHVEHIKPNTVRILH